MVGLSKNISFVGIFPVSGAFKPDFFHTHIFNSIQVQSEDKLNLFTLCKRDDVKLIFVAYSCFFAFYTRNRHFEIPLRVF